MLKKLMIALLLTSTIIGGGAMEEEKGENSKTLISRIEPQKIIARWNEIGEIKPYYRAVCEIRSILDKKYQKHNIQSPFHNSQDEGTYRVSNLLRYQHRTSSGIYLRIVDKSMDMLYTPLGGVRLVKWDETHNPNWEKATEEFIKMSERSSTLTLTKVTPELYNWDQNLENIIITGAKKYKESTTFYCVEKIDCASFPKNESNIIFENLDGIGEQEEKDVENFTKISDKKSYFVPTW